MTDDLTTDQIAAAGKALLGRIYLSTLRVLAEQLENTAATEISAATIQASLKLLDQNAVSLVALADASSPLSEKPDHSARFSNMPDFDGEADLSVYDEPVTASSAPEHALFEAETFHSNGLLTRPYHAIQARLSADPSDDIQWS